MHTPNDEALAGQGQGFQEQSKSNAVDSDAERARDQAIGAIAPRSHTKRLADVTAKLAIQGFSLYPLHDDSLLVTQWGMSKVLPSVEAAERFLAMVGGAG